MKFSEVDSLTVDELRKREKSLREELFEMKMKHSLGQVSNPLKIRGVRRDIAKIKTAMTKKLDR